ncbi:Fc.00g038770.m01.CDS01 [Cosmosporella sp. VM-42]
MSSIFNIKEQSIEASHIREYARATSHTQAEKLLLHVKQYFPKDNPNPRKGDITIIGGHANGFPKEMYEPLWEDFYHEAQKHNIRIRSIVIADAAWQGQSGIINQDSLGNDPGWLDYARDILHIINTLRPPPPLLGMGHSFGANALTNVALLHPRLLTSLVLLDPVTSHFASNPGSKSLGPAALSIHRRDVWPSREEAVASFKRSKFYQAWDPRVLDRWVEFGLRDVPGQEEENGKDGELTLTKTDRWLEFGKEGFNKSKKKEVTLTTTKHQEVFTFLRPSWPAYDAEGKTIIHPELTPDLDPALNEKWPTYPVYRPEGPNTVIRLPELRPSVLYIFGGQSNLSPPELRLEKMRTTGVGIGGSGGAKKGRVKEVVGEEYGHLIPMEAPLLCAKAAAEWVASELERWWTGEREYEEWTKKSRVEKTTISEEFKSYIGKPDRYGAKDKAKI